MNNYYYDSFDCEIQCEEFDFEKSGLSPEDTDEIF